MQHEASSPPPPKLEEEGRPVLIHLYFPNAFWTLILILEAENERWTCFRLSAFIPILWACLCLLALSTCTLACMNRVKAEFSSILYFFFFLEKIFFQFSFLLIWRLNVSQAFEFTESQPKNQLLHVVIGGSYLGFNHAICIYSMVLITLRLRVIRRTCTSRTGDFEISKLSSPTVESLLFNLNQSQFCYVFSCT